MPTAGTFCVRTLVSVSLSLWIMGFLTQPLSAQSSRTDSEETRRSDPTFALVQGQAIVGRLAETHVTILTHYGKLKVPFSEVVRVRFHPRLASIDHARLQTLLEAIRKSPGDEKAASSIRQLGLGAYLSLKAEVERNADANESIAGKLGEIIAELEKIEDAYLEPQDEVVTERFTIRGHVLDSVLNVTRGRLALKIPVADVRHIAYGDLILRKVFKVTSQHMEGSGGFLDTQFKVKKGQRFTLTPSGQMNWQGQAFGPAGISNHTWNSRKMGCLQWRIGKGPWKLLPAAAELKADAAGPIQLCVHLTGSAATGEFKVEFKMKKK